MDSSDQHQMIVVNTYPTGAQEWFCPTCGRHFFLQWPPNYQRIILEEGDKQAAHAGGSGEFNLHSIDIQSGEAADDLVEKHKNLQTPGSGAASNGIPGNGVPGNGINIEDPYLLPWLRWIGDRDF